MTKPRIKLSARQRQQDKARAVHRAINGTVNRCLRIFNRVLKGKQLYFKTRGRAIIFSSEMDEIKKEMLGLKK